MYLREFLRNLTLACGSCRLVVSISIFSFHLSRVYFIFCCLLCHVYVLFAALRGLDGVDLTYKGGRRDDLLLLLPIHLAIDTEQGNKDGKEGKDSVLGVLDLDDPAKPAFVLDTELVRALLFNLYYSFYNNFILILILIRMTLLFLRAVFGFLESTSRWPLHFCHYKHYLARTN